MQLTGITRKWMVLTGLLFCSFFVHGQVLPDSVMIHEPNDSLFILNDSLDFPELHSPVIVVSDEVSLVENLESELEPIYKKHSPAKATIMSAVLPGLGQIYNKKIWKVPIVYAALGVSTYYYIKFQNDYQMFRRAYIDHEDGDPNTNFHETIYIPPNADPKRFLEGNKDYNRRYRDWLILAMIVSYGLNVLDANVDAHFLDYNIDDNLSLRIQPCLLGNDMYSQKIGINLCFTF